jgi:hypothetical protein
LIAALNYPNSEPDGEKSYRFIVLLTSLAFIAAQRVLADEWRLVLLADDFAETLEDAVLSWSRSNKRVAGQADDITFLVIDVLHSR